MSEPLTAHAIAQLRRVCVQPVPKQELNAGVVKKFRDEGLADIIYLPSPYKLNRNQRIAHLQGTAAGLARLMELDGVQGQTKTAR